MPGMEYSHVLLATLGGQPQVVTFTLDLLLQRDIPISEVHIVHPAATPGSRLGRSVERLNAEFLSDYYKEYGRTIHLRRYVLRRYDKPLEDIKDESSADGALNTMHEIISSLKQRHCTVHFSITGGRRLMSFLSISAALLSFGHTDRVWHLYTPEAVQQRVRDGAHMHVPPEDDVRLIEVPLARLGQSILSQAPDPNAGVRALIRSHNERAEVEERALCKKVVDQATLRQLEVLKAFAQGLHPDDVAKQLVIADTTVSTHTTALLKLCREIWPIKEQERLDYRFLQMKFANCDELQYTLQRTNKKPH